MHLQQINRTDAEKVYVLCKNIKGSVASAYYPLFYDVTDATDGTDGHAVSGAGTGKTFLFAGIPQTAIADDAHGLVQVYGKGSAYVLVTTSMIAGAQLNAATSTVHLVNFAQLSSISGGNVIDSPWNFVTSMSAMASGISTAVLEPVFIRAL